MHFVFEILIRTTKNKKDIFQLFFYQRINCPKIYVNPKDPSKTTKVPILQICFIFCV